MLAATTGAEVGCSFHLVPGNYNRAFEDAAPALQLAAAHLSQH
jgi:hypothetical protein